MKSNPFDEYASLLVINGRIAGSLDGWQVSLDYAAVQVWKAVHHASDAVGQALDYQASLKRPYLVSLCREAKNAIPVWNIPARRAFDKNMIQWLNNKEAELEQAAREKVSANQ